MSHTYSLVQLPSTTIKTHKRLSDVMIAYLHAPRTDGGGNSLRYQLCRVAEDGAITIIDWRNPRTTRSYNAAKAKANA